MHLFMVIRKNMKNKDLKIERQAKAKLIEMLHQEIAEIDKQIYAIENEPLSTEDCILKVFSEIDPDSPNREWIFRWHNLLELARLCEQNDRKRTQPLIDAVKTYRVTGAVYDLEEMYKALKTLEENEIQKLF